MKIMTTRQKTFTEQVVGTTKCDKCGIDEKDTEFGALVPVVISINEGEEMGGRDELDFCDPCMLELAPLFVRIYSKIPYVTGEEDEEHPEN